MINIDLICVGSLKSKEFKDSETKILKKIKKIKKIYNLNIIEVEDERNQNLKRYSELEKVKDMEAKRILSKIKKGNYIITLEIDGKKLKKNKLSKLIENLQSDNISLIIGGSVGLSKKITEISNMKLSISNMTFPHQLMRLIILEQLCVID